MAPVSPAGQVDEGAQRTPSEVTGQLATEVIPLLVVGQWKLLTTLVAPTTVGAMQPDKAPPM